MCTCGSADEININAPQSCLLVVSLRVETRPGSQEIKETQRVESVLSCVW